MCVDVGGNGGGCEQVASRLRHAYRVAAHNRCNCDVEDRKQ